MSPRDQPPDPAAGDAPDLVLAYADRADAVVDLHLPARLPADASRRLVVLVHGGFWRERWDRTHTRPMARALAREGAVVATPEFRRVGGGGGWPTTATDVRDAVLALPRLLEDEGVEVAGTTLVGHSAGGHLVLWLASEVGPLERVVALAPVSDLRRAAELGLGDGSTQALLGGGPEEVDYDDADPMVRLAQRPACDVVVLHGTADHAVPVALSRALVAAHPWVRLRELDCGHFELIDPVAQEFGEVVRALKA